MQQQLEFVRNIGRGGLGVVALYQQVSSERYYAVKRMQCEWDENHYQRFVREIKLMSSLTHENIIKVLKYRINGGSPYYIMPYYKNGSLRSILTRMKTKGKTLSPQAATSITYILAKALAYAHSKGAIHRDLKPENILFDGKKPILADWGLGKFIHRESRVLTGSNGQLGTFPYCAPEQWQYGKSDARSDIYSLGLIYRELLVGNIFGTVSDARIAVIINKMTMQNPAQRYQSMQEVVAAIDGLNVVGKNPMEDFWQGLAVIGLIAGAAMLIGSLIDHLLSDE